VKQLIRLQKIKVVQLPSAMAIRNSCDHGWAKAKQYKQTCCRKIQYFLLDDFCILCITAEIVRPMAQLITKTQSNCTLSPEICKPQLSCTQFSNAACSIERGLIDQWPPHLPHTVAFSSPVYSLIILYSDLAAPPTAIFVVITCATYKHFGLHDTN
jgi:hypothetical protein